MPIYHEHHIIPKHAGGSDDPSNLVKLTIEEHAEAHKKLWEEYGRKEDYLAWQGLSGFMGKEEIINQIISKTHKGKIVSEATKEKMRLACKNRPSDYYEKIAIKNRGRKASSEELARRKGQIPWNKGKTGLQVAWNKGLKMS